MHTLFLRLVATSGCIFLTLTSLPASEDGTSRPPSQVFLAAALTGDRVVDVRASEATTVEIVNAVRDAFDDGSGVTGSISVAPTIRRASFEGAESQILLRVVDGTLILHPSFKVDFGVVRAAATHLSKIDGIDKVYIVGIGPFSPPRRIDHSPFGGGDTHDPFAQ